MTERTEFLKTPEGEMEVFVAHPDRRGPYPVVLQLMDALGLREELREHARRVAGWGYYVITPDLFHRFDLLPMTFDEEGAKKVMAAIRDLSNERAQSDVEDALRIVDKDTVARQGELGIYGYCMGGRLALILSELMGARVAAAASIHPGWVLDQPKPHLHLEGIKAELYLGIADEDAMATPEDMSELAKGLAARKVSYQLEWHPGAPHGFMMPSRTDGYNQAAAETVWRRLETLFDRTLKNPGSMR